MAGTNLGAARNLEAHSYLPGDVEACLEMSAVTDGFGQAHWVHLDPTVACRLQHRHSLSWPYVSGARLWRRRRQRAQGAERDGRRCRIYGQAVSVFALDSELGRMLFGGAYMESILPMGARGGI